MTLAAPATSWWKPTTCSKPSTRSASVVNGQTILSTAEAGGSVTFTFDRAYTPAELATMAEEALEWVSTLVAPENPPLDVPRYNRLHPTFRKAVL
jgi:hypothetical protein